MPNDSSPSERPESVSDLLETQEDLSGSVLADRYRVDAILAQGGMGVVYQGWHLVLDTPVAIKVVREEYQGHGEALERFQNEARILASLKSKHTARILDVGWTVDNRPFMVMELLEGQDLQLVLLDHGPLPVQLALEWLLQIAQAVAEAHAKGLVHRDLKPNNMVLTRDVDGSDVLKLIDFGISKSLAKRPRYRTASRDCLGSPQYMSPEQVRSARNVDARSDVWALGVVLYELLTGRCPFQGSTLPAMVSSILQHEPTPPREFRPDIPTQVEDMLLRCLRKQREDRYADANELQAALKRNLQSFDGEFVAAKHPEAAAEQSTTQVGAAKVGAASAISSSYRRAPPVDVSIPLRRSRLGAVHLVAAAAATLLVSLGYAHGEWLGIAPSGSASSLQGEVSAARALQQTPGMVTSVQAIDTSTDATSHAAVQANSRLADQPPLAGAAKALAGPMTSSPQAPGLASTQASSIAFRLGRKAPSQSRLRLASSSNPDAPRFNGSALTREESDIESATKDELREVFEQSIDMEQLASERSVMQEVEDRYALTYEPPPDSPQ